MIKWEDLFEERLNIQKKEGIASVKWCLVAKLFLTLCNTMDCSPPGSL